MSAPPPRTTVRDRKALTQVEQNGRPQQYGIGHAAALLRLLHFL